MVEVDRPDRKSRRAHGKSDPLDAYAAARTVLSGSAAVVPKPRDGRVEAIRALRVARSSAVKARSQAVNQIKALIVTGPAELREQLRHLRTPILMATCVRLRPGQQLGDPEHATKTALRRLARRHQQLSEEIADADHDLDQLVREVAPVLLELPGVGPEVAGQLPGVRLTWTRKAGRVVGDMWDCISPADMVDGWRISCGRTPWCPSGVTYTGSALLQGISCWCMPRLAVSGSLPAALRRSCRCSSMFWVRRER